MNEHDSIGLSSREYWTLSAFAVACVMLVVINISYSQGNRELKQQFTQRQLFIGQTVLLDKIQKQVTNAAIQMALRDKDDDLRQMLAGRGIEVNFGSAALPE